MERELLPPAVPGVRLITRADDLGCARSLNRAVLECVRRGIVRNVSAMAPTPHVEEAARELAGEKGVCFGLHFTLTSEWDRVRWGPVSPPGKVPSLVDDRGFLHPTNRAVGEHASAEEALRELQAQCDRLRRLGFDLRHADLHMWAGRRIPGLMERWPDWCRKEGLIDTLPLGRPLPGLPSPWRNPDRRRGGDPGGQLVAALGAAPPGLYLLIGHPAYDDEETCGLGTAVYPGEAVAHNLDWERRAFTDEAVVHFCREHPVRLIRYDEAVAEMR